MLPTRDPPQDRRPTQTESEALETNIPSKWTGKKKSQGSNTNVTKKQTSKKGPSGETPEGHLVILKGRIHQEDKNIVNIYASNIGAPKYIKKIQEDFKKDIDSRTIIVGDFNIPLQKMDRSSKQNINKDIGLLNNTLDGMDLTNIQRELFIPKKQNTHSFQLSMELFQRQTT